jgi:hypothetical protein
VLPHELLGESLIRFEPGGCLRRTKNTQPRRFKRIDNPIRERIFRPDNRQVDFFAPGDLERELDIVRIAGDVRPQRCRTGIARQNEELL